ncbi:MAG: proton-conducting transporter membrane subunit, partial [Myxococcota bacterium]
IYQLAPEISTVVAIVGAVTAIFAATIGIAQNDIKKVLAYSTVSQLGYMFLAAGVGAYKAAIFHLGTHAFFKACLFLGSGSVIHAMGGEQDMRKMGGLRKHLPSTYKTFLIATLAIAGVPGLAGFFSKDEILGATFLAQVPAAKLLWAVGLATAALTACYMFRLVFLTFFGAFRGTHEQEHHLHESPKVMTLPLWILAVGAVVAGFIGVPSGMWELLGQHDRDWLAALLAPVIAALPGHAAEPHAASHALELLLIGASVAAAALGIFLAWRLWGGGKGLAADDAFAAKSPGLYRLLADKYRVDELYDALFVRPIQRAARICWKVFDELVIDGGLNVAAFLVELTGDLGRFSTTGNVRNYALYFFLGVLLLFGWMVF